MGIDIRQAVATDASAACDLLRRSIEQGCALDHSGRPEVLQNWLSNKLPENVALWLASSTHCALVAEEDGRLLGLALLTQAGKLALCYVQPDQLRRGVGRALLEAIEAQARRWEIRRLSLQSPASAVGFFARLGYADAGLEKSCYGLECNLMWKSLAEDTQAALVASGEARQKRFCPCGQ